MDPSQYPHRILVVVSGMSPQVLTETLFALAKTGQPPFVPTEVHLISTGSGARHARLTLLEGDAQFLRLCADHSLEPTLFDASRIHAIVDANGLVVDDIRTAADNEAAADFITGFIREQTGHPEAAVHVSLAGGRKTMGYYAGYALSLYGREQDRLSHVLISEGFEGHAGFYYPTPASRPIYRDGKPALDAREAKVELAEIPFVRLRDELTDHVLARSFRAAVASANRARQPPTMSLDLGKLEFRVGETSLANLGTASLAFLCWVAWRQASGHPGLAVREIMRDGKALGLQFASVCERLQDRDEHRTAEARRRGQSVGLALPQLSSVMDALRRDGLASRADFDYRRSRLNSGLARLLGTPLARHFQLRNSGPRGQACYGLADSSRNVLLVVPPEFGPLGAGG